MEYAGKGDLNSVIKKKILNNNESIIENVIWNWFIQITSAIKYIHGKKILHRDIKVENIFISSNNTLKLGDFGISKCLKDTSDYALSGVGTPYYLSPEICQGLKYNFKSDIWMLGCLLYELCTLKKPFKSDSINELIKNIIKEEPEKIQKIEYTDGLKNLIQIMLKKSPEDRPDIEAVWLITQFCCKTSKTNSSTVKLIDKNKLKIEVEDQDNCLMEIKNTPLSSELKYYKNSIISYSEEVKNYKIQQKLTPNNYRFEINKIRKNMNLSPINTPTTNVMDLKRKTSYTTTNSTPKIFIKNQKYIRSNSNNINNAPEGNTGRNFKNKHFRHISINISSIQSPEHNAIYQIDNIEKVESIKFYSPINSLKCNKPILTPTNNLNINTGKDSGLLELGLRQGLKLMPVSNPGSGSRTIPRSGSLSLEGTGSAQVSESGVEKVPERSGSGLGSGSGFASGSGSGSVSWIGPGLVPEEDFFKKEIPLTTKAGKINTIQYNKEEIINRKTLIKNFLIQRYTKEKFEKMYNLIMKNKKIDANIIKEIAGEDYKIAINYFGYLTSKK